MTATAPSVTRPAPGDRGRARRQAVGEAERLRRAVADRVAQIVAGVEGGGRALGRVHVGWYAAMEARDCPARYRAQGQDGWAFPGWSAPTAAAAVGRAALVHHVAAHEQAGFAPWREPPCPAPLEAVRTWMRAARAAPDGGVADWVAERAGEGDDAALAAAAAGATRWIAGFVRVLGWPLPERLRLLDGSPRSGDRPLRWPAGRGSSVTVASGADGLMGRVAGAGNFALVVHRERAGDDGRVRDRAAFEAAAGALAIGVTPAEVVVTAADTGERLRVPVDADLLRGGADLVTGVVVQRAAAVERGSHLPHPTPSPRCRWCEQLSRCEAGREWLAVGARRRGGLPLV